MLNIRIEVFFLNPKVKISSFCAHVLKYVTFVIGKLKLMFFSLFLDASPLDPRCHLDNEM